MVDFHKLRELGFDSENAKERFLGSEEFYFSCMKIYIRANDIAKLTELCRACDWENALECVHTMKGSTGNLALYGLYSHYSAMTRPFPLGGAAESGFLAPGGPGDGRKNALRRRILRRPGGRIGIVNTIRSRKMQKIYKKGLANFTEI